MRSSAVILILLFLVCDAFAVYTGFGMRRGDRRPAVRGGTQAIEVVRWRQPVCIAPAEGITSCQDNLRRHQAHYEQVNKEKCAESGAEKSRNIEESSGRGNGISNKANDKKINVLPPTVISPGISGSISIDDVELAELDMAEGTEGRTMKLRSKTPEINDENLRRGKYLIVASPEVKSSYEPQIYVTKVLDVPMTATLIAENCLPDIGVPLCDGWEISSSKTERVEAGVTFQYSSDKADESKSSKVKSDRISGISSNRHNGNAHRRGSEMSTAHEESVEDKAERVSQIHESEKFSNVETLEEGDSKKSTSTAKGASSQNIIGTVIIEPAVSAVSSLFGVLEESTEISSTEGKSEGSEREEESAERIGHQEGGEQYGSEAEENDREESSGKVSNHEESSHEDEYEESKREQSKYAQSEYEGSDRKEHNYEKGDREESNREVNKYEESKREESRREESNRETSHYENSSRKENKYEESRREVSNRETSHREESNRQVNKYEESEREENKRKHTEYEDSSTYDESREDTERENESEHQASEQKHSESIDNESSEQESSKHSIIRNIKNTVHGILNDHRRKTVAIQSEEDRSDKQKSVGITVAHEYQLSPLTVIAKEKIVKTETNDEISGGESILDFPMKLIPDVKVSLGGIFGGRTPPHKPENSIAGRTVLDVSPKPEDNRDPDTLAKPTEKPGLLGGLFRNPTKPLVRAKRDVAMQTSGGLRYVHSKPANEPLLINRPNEKPLYVQNPVYVVEKPSLPGFFDIFKIFKKPATIPEPVETEVIAEPVYIYYKPSFLETVFNKPTKPSFFPVWNIFEGFNLKDKFTTESPFPQFTVQPTTSVTGSMGNANTGASTTVSTPVNTPSTTITSTVSPPVNTASTVTASTTASTPVDTPSTSISATKPGAVNVVFNQNIQKPNVRRVYYY